MLNTINLIYNELTEQLLEQFKERLIEHKINLLILNYLKFSKLILKFHF